LLWDEKHAGIQSGIRCCYVTMDSRKLLERIEQLPSLKRMEAEDFIEFLASRHESNEKMRPMTFSWAGGLSDLKPQYTSRDLKKQAMEWMTGHVG
jgi:hypothetical protein